MFLKYLFFGFAVKFLTGIDDTFTKIPIISAMTRRRIGKIAFSIGNLFAVIAAVIVAYLFSAVLETLPFSQALAAILIFILAFVVYFELFEYSIAVRAEKKLPPPQHISTERFLKLVVAGFIVSLVMILDDVIALAPLFLSKESITIRSAMLGIALATILQIILVIYVAGKMDKLQYKKEIAAASLVVLGLFVLFGIV